jgi:aspartate ammonia-lyase
LRNPSSFIAWQATSPGASARGCAAAGEQLSGGAAPIVATWRMEHDLLGERELPDTAYYGVQTLRGMENFPLSGIPLRHFQHFVRALALVKKAAAAANSELGVLDQERAKAIAAACEEIIAGKLHEHFTVDMIQGWRRHFDEHERQRGHR